MSRKAKKSTLQISKFSNYIEEGIYIFNRCCREQKCENIPTVLIQELPRDYEICQPKIILGIKKPEKPDFPVKVDSLQYKQYALERATVLALEKYAFEVKMSLASLKLEYCNLTAEQIRIFAKILSMSFPILQELSLNGNPNEEQNHFLLIQNNSLLSCSLKFCEINAEGMKNIANAIANSDTILHLNLTGNLLGDDGMEHVANFLRTNRSLVSLNLTDNKIRDEGCIKLMAPFLSFKLLMEELIIRRTILFDYFRNKLAKEEIISTETMRRTSQSAKLGKRAKEKSTPKALKVAAKKGQKEPEFETIILKDVQYNPFVHDSDEVDTEVYCRGNQVLNSLNLSYNQISIEGLNQIEMVINHQKSLLPKKGLARLILQGNVSTEECLEKVEKLEQLLHNEEEEYYKNLNIVIKRDAKVSRKVSKKKSV